MGGQGVSTPGGEGVPTPRGEGVPAHDLRLLHDQTEREQLSPPYVHIWKGRQVSSFWLIKALCKRWDSFPDVAQRER
jgi:hypothetical protein